MAWAAVALAVVSAMQKANADKAAANSAAQNYESAANAAATNEANAEQNQQQAEQATSSNEDAVRRANNLKLGQLRAAQIESGGNPAAGSDAAVYHQSDVNAVMDALNTRYTGLMQARGYGLQAQGYATDETTALTNEAQAKKAGQASFMSDIIGGAASAYSAYQGSQVQTAQTNYYKANSSSGTALPY